MDKKTKKRFWKRVACVFGILFVFCLGFNAVGAVIQHYSIESLDVVYRIDDLSNEKMMELKTFLIEDKTNTLELTNPDADCRTYTIELIEKGKCVGITFNLATMLINTDLPFLHGIAYTYVDNELIFIEPQTDAIYTTDELMDEYNYDYLSIFEGDVETVLYPTDPDFILNGDI